jgi:hypothetical protein
MLQRMKERKLVQWGVAYLAGAWVLLEVLSEIGEHTSRGPTWRTARIDGCAGAGAPARAGAGVVPWGAGPPAGDRAGVDDTVLLLTASGVLWLVGRPGAALAASDDADVVVPEDGPDQRQVIEANVTLLEQRVVRTVEQRDAYPAVVPPGAVLNSVHAFRVRVGLQRERLALGIKRPMRGIGG